MRAPSPIGELNRLRDLSRYHIVYTPSESVFDDLIALTAQICAVPVAAISFFTDTAQWFKSSIGPTLDELPFDQYLLSLLAHEIDGFAVPDLLAVGGASSCALAPRWPGIRYYAGIPLRSPQGSVLGALVVADDRPHQYATAEREALTLLGRQIMSLLELRLHYHGADKHSTEGQWLEPQVTHMTSLSVMARGIGHALRNPFAIISGAAQIALAHPDEADLITTSMRQVHIATMRAGLIMDNLLSFAQPRREVAELVDVNEVVAAALEQFDDLFRQLQITSSLTLLPEAVPVVGNAELLHIVCNNLILNACQAMERGGILAVMIRMKAGDRVEIRITDQGCGIAADILPQIFDPFFTTKPAGKSLGLGLAVCYSIIQEHEGRIAVCSQPGAGSTFEVCLPVAGSPIPPFPQLR